MPARSPILNLPPEILEIICSNVFEPYDLEVEDWAHDQFDKACRKSRALMFLLDDGRVYDNYRRLAVSSTSNLHRYSDSILFTCRSLSDIARRARQQLFSGVLRIHGKNRLDRYGDLEDKLREYCTRVLSSSADTNLRARVRLIRYQTDRYRKSDLKLIAGAFPNLSVFEVQRITIATRYVRGEPGPEMSENVSDFYWCPTVENFASDVAELEAMGNTKISCHLYTEVRFGVGTWARIVVSRSRTGLLFAILIRILGLSMACFKEWFQTDPLGR